MFSAGLPRPPPWELSPRACGGTEGRATRPCGAPGLRLQTGPPAPRKKVQGAAGAGGQIRAAPGGGAGQGRAFPRARPARSVIKNPPFLPLGTSSTLQTQRCVSSVERCDSPAFRELALFPGERRGAPERRLPSDPSLPGPATHRASAGRRTPPKACPNQGPTGSEAPGKAKHLNWGTGPGWGAGSG